MGVPAGFEAFFRGQFGPLVGVLFVYCGDRALAEEFAAEALSRAARDWERVSRMAAPSGWLHRVAFNVANSHFRRRRAERRAMDRQGPPPDPADHGGQVAGAVAVRRAVTALPRRQREAVALFYFADLTVAEVADVMRIPQNTVKSLLFRARAAMREVLDDTASVEEPSDAR